jgi:rare lipoprotein A
VETIIPDGSAGTAFATAPRSAPSSPAVRPSGAVARSRPSTVDMQATTEADPILAIAMAAAARESEAAARTPSDVRLGAAASAPVGAYQAEGDGIYLQLGAFGSRDNAESYLDRAKTQLDWLAQTLHLFPRDGMYRVHAGPYPSAFEARQAAERIALAVGSKPVIVSR